MKKILALVVLVLVLLAIGCSTKVDVIGTWVTNENSKYTFTEDGACTKEVNYEEQTCTYTINGGIIDIELDNGVKESGQITSKQIVIGSEIYEKEK